MARNPTAPTTAYTGAWRASSSYSDRALPPGPGADPSHMRPDAPDPGQVSAGYPRVDYAPLYLTTEPDDAWAFELDTPGLILDTEPITHDANDPQVIHASPIPGAEFAPPSLSAHSISRGRDIVGQHEEPQMRGGDEQPRTERWEQAAILSPSVTAERRGTNALPENNPEGYRLGYSVKRFYHRRMPTEQMEHTERAMRPMKAAAAVNSPALTPAQSNRYTSPFAWLSFYGTKARQRPILRRQPPEAWDADVSGDGTNQASDVPADWVVG